MLWISPKATCPRGYPADGCSARRTRRIPGPRPARTRGRRRVPAADPGARRARGRRDQGRPRRRGRPPRRQPLAHERVPAALPARGDGRAAERHGRDLPAPRRSARSASCRASGRGDQPGSSVGLQRAIVAASDRGDERLPDVGLRHRRLRAPRHVDTELFVRWAQFGAVSPGDGGRRPWRLDPVDARPGGDGRPPRRAAVLHYELFPYLYGLIAPHQPVLRPLGFGFPGRRAGVGLPNFELLVGPDLLAAPVTDPGVTPSRLPAARLLGRPLHGERPWRRRSFTRQTAADQFPLYARLGAVMPFNLRTATGSWWGDERAHASGPGRLPRDERGEARPHRAAPRRAAVRSGSARPSRVTLGGQGGRLELECRARFPGSSSACTGRPFRERSPSSS